MIHKAGWVALPSDEWTGIKHDKTKRLWVRIHRRDADRIERGRHLVRRHLLMATAGRDIAAGPP